MNKRMWLRRDIHLRQKGPFGEWIQAWITAGWVDQPYIKMIQKQYKGWRKFLLKQKPKV